MITKIAKNELTKTFRNKQFYILLAFVIVMVSLSAYFYNDIRNNIIAGSVGINRYTPESIEIFKNMNAITFMSMFLSDFIFKATIPFFVIFMIIFSVRTFSEDNVGGNLKFFVLDVNNKVDICYGKLLYLLLIITIVVLINISLSFLLGLFVFGISEITIKEVLYVLFVYFSSIIPVLAFSSLIGIVSMVSSKSNTFIIIGIMGSVLISLLDKFTYSKYFSPIGIISKIADKDIFNMPMMDLVQSNFVALLYFTIAVVIGTVLFRKKEWVY